MGAGILTLIVLCVLLQTCSAGRDPNVTLLTLPGVVGVWNRSEYPASQFRDESVVGYFDIWPEYTSDVKFMYFCEDPSLGNLSLSNFTYSLTENRLIPRPYYDLGVVNSYLPYWHYWRFWYVDLKRISYPINCEYHDLHKLYLYRFWNVPLWQGFKLFLVMQTIVMTTVFVITNFHRIIKREDSKEPNQPEQPDCGRIVCKMMDLGRPWTRDCGHFVSEMIHLGLVAEVGSCMLESIGHNPLRSWRATFMFNTAVIYSWLSLFAMLAAIVRQITTGWDPDDDYSDNISKGHTRDLSMGREKWFALQTITDDWRWQRVFLQMGTLVLIGTYLTSVDDASGLALDQMAALLLAAAVVACTCSFGVSAVSLFRFLFVLARKLANKVGKRLCPSCMPRSGQSQNISTRSDKFMSCMRFDQCPTCGDNMLHFPPEEGHTCDRTNIAVMFTEPPSGLGSDQRQQQNISPRSPRAQAPLI